MRPDGPRPPGLLMAGLEWPPPVLTGGTPVVGTTLAQRASFGEAPRAIATSLSLLEGAIRFQLASLAGDGRMVDFGDSHALAGYSPRTLELAAARRIVLDERGAPLAMTPCQARELCAGMYGSFGIYVDPWRISPVLATLSAELAMLAANCTAAAPAEPLGSATVTAFLDGGFAALRVPLMAARPNRSAPPPCFAPNGGRAEPFCIDRAMPSLADAIPYSLLALNGRPSSFIKSEIDFGTVTWSAWGSRLLSEFGYGTIATTQGGDDTRRMAWLDNNPAGHNTLIVREAFQSAARGDSEDEINFSQFNFVAGQMRVVNVSRGGDGGGGAGGGGEGGGGGGERDGGADACVLMDGSDVYGAARPNGWLEVMRRYACPLSEGDTPAFMLLDVLQVKANRTRLTLDGAGRGGPAYTEATPAHAALHCEEFFHTETAAVLATDGSGSPIGQELPFDTEANPRSSRCGHVDVSTLGADAASVLLRPRCGLGEHREPDGVASISGFASTGGGGRFVVDGLVTAPDRWLTAHSYKKRRFRFVTEAPTGVGGDVRAFVLAPAAAHNRSAPPVVRLASCTAAIGCAVGAPLLQCTCIELCAGSVLRWAIVMDAELVALHAVGTCDVASSTPDAPLVHRARLATLGAWPTPPAPPPVPPVPPLPPPRDGAREVQHKVRLRLTAAGSVSDFDDERRSRLRSSLARLASVDAADVELTISAASVAILALIAVADASAASSAASSLGAQLANTTAATSLLGVQIETSPLVEAIVVAAPAPPPQAPGMAVLAAIGGVAALLLLPIAGFALRWRRRGCPRAKGVDEGPSCVRPASMGAGAPVAATSPRQSNPHAKRVLKV